MEKELIAKLVVGAICIIVFVASYQTKDLDGVENAWMYRCGYALMMVKGILFIAVDLLGLWSRAG